MHSACMGCSVFLNQCCRPAAVPEHQHACSAIDADRDVAEPMCLSANMPAQGLMQPAMTMTVQASAAAPAARNGRPHPRLAAFQLRLQGKLPAVWPACRGIACSCTKALQASSAS